MSTRPEPAARSLPDTAVVEQFLYREARLLDEQRWDEWNDLFTADGVYWVPAAPGQPDAVNHVSLIHESALLRAVRIKRFRHPNAFSLQPRPRSVHLLSNVMLDGLTGDAGEFVVSSSFLMLQFRRDQQDVFGGRYTHHLRHTDGGLRIALKRVDLVNCDAPMENILVYL